MILWPSNYAGQKSLTFICTSEGCLLFLRPTQEIALHFSYIDHIYMQFSVLNLSDIKMVPQYCSNGSAGVPAVPATIFMSEQ